MTEYNAERIVQARHLESMTQRELSERSRISQSKLSKLQNGFIVFKENEARAIAAALGFPIAYFTREDPILPMTAVTYRKTSKSSMGELAAVSIEYSELCATVSRLAKLLGISAGKTAWIRKIAPRKPELSVSEIDRIANQARTCMGLEPIGPIGNLTRSLERQGIVVAPMKSTGGSDDERARLTSEGITYPQCEGMPCIGYSAGKRIGGDRQRFTKAHELGHLILHRFRRPDTSQQMEREAHLFAGALLLPAEDMLRSRRYVALHSEECHVKRLPQNQIRLGRIRCRVNQSSPYVGYHQCRTLSFLADPIVQSGMAQTGTRQCGGGASAAAQADDPGRVWSRLKHRWRAGDQVL